jgi:hypothetical protein
LVHKLIQQETYKQQSHNKQGKHARDSSKSDKAQKVFVGPHFCITELFLNRVTKVGVLQVYGEQTR